LEVTVKRDAYIHDASSHYINFEPMSNGVPDILWKDDGTAEYHPIIWDGYDINDVKVSRFVFVLSTLNMKQCCDRCQWNRMIGWEHATQHH
jgi:hypothetical protein